MEIKSNKNRLKSYVCVILSCIFFAFSVDVFLKPNQIVGGGVTGLSLLLNHFMPFGVGLIGFILNVPIMVSGFFVKGKAYVIKCLVLTAFLNFLIDTFSFLPALTKNPLMASIYAGVLFGISVGLNYRYQVSSGGTELLSQLIVTKLKNSTVGKILIIIDGSIVLIASIVLQNPKNVLLAVLMIFITGKVSDIITGFNYKRIPEM